MGTDKTAEGGFTDLISVCHFYKYIFFWYKTFFFILFFHFILI